MNCAESEIILKIHLVSQPYAATVEYLQVTDFMSSNNNTTETASVLNDGYTVDFFQSFVYYASAAHISKSFEFDKNNELAIVHRT